MLIYNRYQLKNMQGEKVFISSRYYAQNFLKIAGLDI